jgi:uncharacterized protein YeaO (DUF488 family)
VISSRIVVDYWIRGSPGKDGRVAPDLDLGHEQRRWVAMSRQRVRVRRAYDEPQRGDGARVLVDRLWPRGLSRERADLDEWCKDVAPSPELRKWYAHDPERFAEFRRRYRAELRTPARAKALDHLRALARRRNLTLLTATKAADISEAAVLVELLDGH